MWTRRSVSVVEMVVMIVSRTTSNASFSGGPSRFPMIRVQHVRAQFDPAIPVIQGPSSPGDSRH